MPDLAVGAVAYGFAYKGEDMDRVPVMLSLPINLRAEAAFIDRIAMVNELYRVGNGRAAMWRSLQIVRRFPAKVWQLTHMAIRHYIGPGRMMLGQLRRRCLSKLLPK